MTVNVGSFDRLARLIVGAALIAFALGYIARHGMELGRLDRRDRDPDRTIWDLPRLQSVRMVNAITMAASAPPAPSHPSVRQPFAVDRPCRRS
jgi:hypothetical protein